MVSHTIHIESISEMKTGRVEILQPAGQARWKTGQILLSRN